VIGQYEQCSYRLAGKGTFFGTDATNPTVGLKGRREDVDEWRLEVVVPEGRLDQVVKAMRAAHSYEEPAFDVYQLHPASSGGEGRVGDLDTAVTLGELANRAKSKLNAGFAQVVGDSARTVRRVAVACGAAGEFLADSIRAEADVFLTGGARPLCHRAPGRRGTRRSAFCRLARHHDVGESARARSHKGLIPAPDLGITRTGTDAAR
jgi:hypothetical protein